MSNSFSLHTHNSPEEEIFNLVTQRTENSRVIELKRDGNILRGRREIIYPNLTSMGRKISSAFPDKIYMNFSVRKTKDGIYMKNVLPNDYSEYVKGCEKIFIKDNGDIDVAIEYKIIRSESSNFMDFKSIVYNKTIDSLESYILSIYESKRRISFGKHCEEKINCFEDILERY